MEVDNPKLSLTAAQRIVTRLRTAIMLAHPEVTDVLVHLTEPYTAEQDPLGGSAHRSGTLR
eukprot:COSAG03_NODE_3431_length_2021_cov_1.366285_1_plen_60_part_10